MSIFTVDDAAALPGPEGLRQRRTAAMERYLAGPMPTAADEIWRYSRIDDLDLSLYPMAQQHPAPAGLGDDLVAAVGARSSLLETVDGWPSASAASEGDPGRVSDESDPWDAFVTLNDALNPGPVVIDIPQGTVVQDPIVVVHRIVTAAATFPRTIVTVGANAQATVVELVVSDDVAAFVAPVVELDVADGGHLDHLVVQQLGPRVWETAYHASRVGRASTLRAFTVALGGDYARVRTDSRLVGAGGSTDLLALYFGDGAQMHDFRTLQDHDAPKTTSELIFKGAVIGEARSAYSGLIRVRPGAAGTKAFQTNRNLVLSDTGLATYSVPNLDIQENEVTCSHASATGPIDTDQLFYLESRGVPTEVAERLIVLGFFDDLLARLPTAGLRAPLWAAVAAKLGGGVR